MNFINMFFLENKITNIQENTARKLLKDKADFFCIDESLKLNKLAFAYFLDRKNSQDDQEINDLSHYEYFPGSLTAEQFAIELKKFLNSPQSTFLSDEIKQNISKFAASIEKGIEQGSLVDLFRSTDLRLIFLAITGRNIGGSIDQNLSDTMGKKLSEETIKQIRTLKEGEQSIFLLGTLFHETRMTVEKTKSGWEVNYFDSNDSAFSTFQCDENSTFLSSKFWQTVYSLKFSNNVRYSFSGLLSTVGYKINALGAFGSSLRTQIKNTCHFRSLLAALKKELVQSPQLDAVDAIKGWHDFKVAFGDYLLQNNSLDARIKLPAMESQTHRKEKSHVIELHVDHIKRGLFEQTKNAYSDVIKRLSPYDGFFLSNNLCAMNTLAICHAILLIDINSLLIEPDKLKSLVHSGNTGIEYAFDLSQEIYNKKKNETKKRIDEEIQKIKSGYHPFIETTVETITEICKNTIKDLASKVNSLKDKVLDFLSPDHNPTDLYAKVINMPVTSPPHIFVPLEGLKLYPLDEIDIEHYLKEFLQDPSLLQLLEKRPQRVFILLQALQMGKVSEVQNIYDNLEPDEQRIMFYHLGSFIRGKNVDKKISYHYLPTSILESYASLSKASLSELFIPLLLKKSLIDCTPDYFLRVLLCLKKNTSMDEIESLLEDALFEINPTEDHIKQLMTCFNKMAENPGDKIDAESLEIVFKALLSKALLRNWLDFLEENPHPSAQQMYIKLLKSNSCYLQHVSSKKVFLKNHPNHFLAKMIKDN